MAIGVPLHTTSNEILKYPSGISNIVVKLHGEMPHAAFLLIAFLFYLSYIHHHFVTMTYLCFAVSIMNLYLVNTYCYKNAKILCLGAKALTHMTQ